MVESGLRQCIANILQEFKTKGEYIMSKNMIEIYKIESKKVMEMPEDIWEYIAPYLSINEDRSSYGNEEFIFWDANEVIKMIKKDIKAGSIEDRTEEVMPYLLKMEQEGVQSFIVD